MAVPRDSFQYLCAVVPTCFSKAVAGSWAIGMRALVSRPGSSVTAAPARGSFPYPPAEPGFLVPNGQPQHIKLSLVSPRTRTTTTSRSMSLVPWCPSELRGVSRFDWPAIAWRCTLRFRLNSSLTRDFDRGQCAGRNVQGQCVEGRVVRGMGWG